MSYCQNCGKQINEGSSFCPYCGTNINDSHSISSQNHANSTKPSRPENYLIWAILCTLFCCLPLGIVSIISSTKVNNYYDSGDYENAVKASQDAKKWATYGVLTTVILSGVYFLIALIGIAGL